MVSMFNTNNVIQRTDHLHTANHGAIGDSCKHIARLIRANPLRVPFEFGSH